MAGALLSAALVTGCGGAGEGRGEVVELVSEPAGPETVTPAPGVTYEIERLPPEQLVLTGAVGSLDEILSTVETALADHDTTRLLDLMVTEREYREILFPAFPAAHPPIGADVASIWVNHFGDAYPGMLQLVGRLGGHDVDIVDIRFDAPNQDFVNFVLHETSRVDVVIDGRRYDDVRLFGSVFRVGDQWKLLSYPDD